MGILRDRIAYRRATPETAPIMADMRERFSQFGDDLDHLMLRQLAAEQRFLPFEEGEFENSYTKMLDALEDASRHAIKAVLLATGTPIDDAPAEATYRGGDTR